MDGLEIFDLQTLQIPLRCFDARVSEDLREIEEIPASPEIRNCEGVSERMRTRPNAFDSELPAKKPKIPLDITHRHPRVISRLKQESLLWGLRSCGVFPHSLAKFKRHGHHSMLAAFSGFNADQEIVEIYCIPGNCQRFRDSQPRIQQQADKRLEALPRSSVWFPRQQSADLLRVEGVQNLLFLLKPRELHEVLSMLEVQPAQVCIYAPQIRVD